MCKSISGTFCGVTYRVTPSGRNVCSTGSVLYEHDALLKRVVRKATPASDPRPLTFEVAPCLLHVVPDAH